MVWRKIASVEPRAPSQVGFSVWSGAGENERQKTELHIRSRANAE